MFRVVVEGSFAEPAGNSRADEIGDSLRALLVDSQFVLTQSMREFEAVLRIEATTENEALAFGRVAVTSALFDAGYSRLDSSISDVSVRPLH